MRVILLTVLWLASTDVLWSQSVEIMGGNQRLFADVQWLKPLDTTYTWSVFSRARATIDYEGRSNLFLGVYGNVTSKIGLGGTLLGRIGTTASGGDVGAHYFKSTKKWLFFGLASVGLNTHLELGYTWFSILRFTPPLAKNLKLYTSLELFTTFNNRGHVYSTQRVRLGLDWKGWQLGVANNLAQIGQTPILDNNIGAFIRKEF